MGTITFIFFLAQNAMESATKTDPAKRNIATEPYSLGNDKFVLIISNIRLKQLFYIQIHFRKVTHTIVIPAQNVVNYNFHVSNATTVIHVYMEILKMSLVK